MKIKIPSEIVQCSNFINGEFKLGTGNNINVFSPYSGSIIGKLNISTKSNLEEAVKFASEAQKNWAETPIKERSKIFYKFRELLIRDINELSHIKCSESGKTFEEGKAGILKGIEVLEYALSLQNLDIGGKLEVSRGVSCEYRRIPLGVVASITPFNFPAMVPMWTIPIAIILGNSYIWKPSEKTPLTSIFIAKLLKEAGLPDGIFQVIQGDKSTVDEILLHPDIKAISFVGSTKVAEIVYKNGTQNGKRILALGGAKNHIVLLPDANPEISGIGISDSFTGCAGQRCMAASVLLTVGKEIDTKIHVEKIIERASSLKLGENLGAIITNEQLKFLNNSIELALKNGATLLLDGRNKKLEAKLNDEYKNGNWLGPTILGNVKPDSFIANTELFGPILAIINCEDISKAMEYENKNPYGNACSVFTSSGQLAEKVIKKASAGMVGVNVGVPVPREPFSFGGIRNSKFGHGDITGDHSLDFWTDMKKITIKWEGQNDNNWMS